MCLLLIQDKEDEKMKGFPTIIFPEAVPNNHTRPDDDDIERSLCVELFVVVDLRFLNLRVERRSTLTFRASYFVSC